MHRAGTRVVFRGPVDFRPPQNKPIRYPFRLGQLRFGSCSRISVRSQLLSGEIVNSKRTLQINREIIYCNIVAAKLQRGPALISLSLEFQLVQFCQNCWFSECRSPNNPLRLALDCRHRESVNPTAGKQFECFRL